MKLQADAAGGADFVFVGGLTGHDLRTGRPLASLDDLPEAARAQVRTGTAIADVPEERIRAQTLLALDHAERVLAAHGSSLRRLARLRLFLRDMRDCAGAAGAVRAVLGADLPSTTLVEATGPGVDPDVDVVLDCIGVRDDAAFAPRHVRVPELDALLAGFPAATVCGPYVFTTPVSAADPRTGRIERDRATLDAREQALLDDRYVDPRQEALAVEQVLMWRNIGRILAATGVPFEAVLHQNNWLTVSMQHYVPVTRVRGRLFGLAQARTAATSLPVSGVRTPGAAFEASVIGVVPGDAAVRKEIRLDSHAVGPYYVGAVKAGPWLFAAGEVPVRGGGEGLPRVIARAADLDDALRLLGLGRVHAEEPLMAQAHCVYALIGEALERYGADFGDVVHQTVYLVEPAAYPALERIATLRFGACLPPTTLVPIRGASPFRETLLEIEVTARLPG